MAERTERIQVRLSPEMNARLRTVAEEMGIPFSTVGAFAISEFIVRKEREKSAHQAAREVFVDEFKEMFSNVMQQIDEGEIAQAQIERITNAIKD